MTRVLILTADIGAGHDLPAELLSASLREHEPTAAVTIADALAASGRVAIAITRSGVEFVLERLPRLFDVQYWLIARFPPTKWLGGKLAMLLGHRAILRLIAEHAPDVVVSTYPGSTEVLGRLRAAGRVSVPCVSAITDLAALGWWAHPGIDLHLMIHEESRAEVESIAGPGADIRHVRGFSRPQFERPPSRQEARAALGLPAETPVVLVSGGGWGVGEVERAARTVLAVDGATAVCLCGSNAALRARLQASHAGDPRVRVEGFTDRMAEWMAAADVLVHSTAGLTVLEAQMTGTWAISYGWGVGHVRINNHAYRQFGLADVAATEAQLSEALRRALAAPRPRDFDFGALPTAAEAVLEISSRRSPGP